ncbi:hypothetical protein [Streptomyces sp. NPDC001594]|uniref:hypothetical protein n=1 Tax=Streptomyces sp. NPDC001594 TaxID=3364590 RepID=UPI003696ABB3
MMEILENLDVLSQPHLDLTAIRMGGIALGAPADSIPRQRILEAQSSVVARYRGGDDIDSEYHDSDGRRLTLDQVIDHTVRSDGFLYCAEELTYKVSGGLVVGFAIYGPHLSHFAHLTSYESCWMCSARPIWCVRRGRTATSWATTSTTGARASM